MMRQVSIGQMNFSVSHIKKAFLISLAMIVTWLICIQQGSDYSSAGIMAAMLFMTERHSGAQLVRFGLRTMATLFGGSVTFMVAQYHLADTLVFSAIAASAVVVFTMFASFNRMINPNVAYVFSIAGLTVCFTAFPTTYNPSVENLNDVVIARLVGMLVAIVVCGLVSALFYSSKIDEQVQEELRQFREGVLGGVRRPFLTGSDVASLEGLKNLGASLLRQYTEVMVLNFFSFNSKDKMTSYELRYYLMFLEQQGQLNEVAARELSEEQMLELNRLFLHGDIGNVELQDRVAECCDVSVEMLEKLSAFITSRELIKSGEIPSSTTAIYKANWRVAWRNTARSALGLTLLLTFWYVSGWDKGANSMMIAGTLYVMFASLPIPPKVGALIFLVGHLICATFSYIILFAVMPSVAHPAVLFITIGVFLWVFAYKHITSPMPVAVIYMFVIMFWPVYLDLANVPLFDEVSIINSAIANLSAGVFVRFSYLLVDV